MPRLTKVFAYIRMSTDDQENSPDQQRKAIIAYAKEHGFKIIEWFEDLGISGDRTDKRVGFQRMINAASVREVSGILCWDQDRFGRFDMIEAGVYIHPLRKANVFLETVTEGRIDFYDMAQRLTYSVKQEAKHDLCRSLSKNVTRALEQYAESGKWPAGQPPFGYVVGPDRRLHVDPEQAKIVREIFKRYSRGDSAGAIVRWLNEIGVESARGKGFTSSRIREMVRNDHYLGYTTYNRTSRSKYKKSNAAGQLISKVKKEWIVSETKTHEAIVSRDVFDACQVRRVSNKRATTRTRRPLTGVLRCKHCQQGMVRNLRSDGRPVYTCYSYQMKGECQRFQVYEDEALKLIAKVLREEYFSLFAGKRNREKILKSMRKQLTGKRGNVEVLKAQLNKVDNQIKQAESRLLEVPPDMINRVSEKIREYEDRRDSLAQQLEEAGQPTGNIVSAVEQRMEAAIAWLDDLEALITSGNKPAETNQAITKMIDRVDLEISRKPIKPGSTRHRCTVEGGIIHVKTGVNGVVPCLDGLGGQTVQAGATMQIAFGVCA